MPKEQIEQRMAYAMNMGDFIFGMGAFVTPILVAFLIRRLRLERTDRRLVLIAAVSGGFASVFSVPLAGAVFGLEVQSVGRIRYDAIVPALTAAIVGNVTFHALDLPHHVTPHYELAAVGLSIVLLGKVALAALVFGLASVVFSELTEGIKRAFGFLFSWPPLRPVVGGAAVIGLTFLVGSRDYLGLSLPLIDQALTGCSLVVTWHSNVAVDAIRMGIPVVCRDGAAAAVCPSSRCTTTRATRGTSPGTCASTPACSRPP